MKPERFARITWMVFSAVVAVVAIGFWFSADEGGEILGRYATRPLLKRVLITLGAYFLVLYLRFVLLPRRGVSPDRMVSLRAKIVGAICLALLATGAIEVYLQVQAHRARASIVAQRQKGEARYDPFLQLTPIPGDPRMHINRWGFRGNDIEREKPAGTYRIFVLGGSTVYGNHLTFEESLPRVLEKELRRRKPGVRIEVQNAAMDWHTSQHSLMKFLFKIHDFEPDMIVVYHAINDLYRGFEHEVLAPEPYTSDYSHYHGAVAHVAREYFDPHTAPGLLAPGYLAALFTDHWFTVFREKPTARGPFLAGGIGGAIMPPPPADLPEVPVDDWPSLEAFDRNMQHIVPAARSCRVELILATQPYIYREGLSAEALAKVKFPKLFCRVGNAKADIPSMKRGMDAFNDRTRKIAIELDVPFVDLERLVPKSLDYFIDDVHYTVKGSEFIAGKLADRIVALRAFEVAAPR